MNPYVTYRMAHDKIDDAVNSAETQALTGRGFASPAPLFAARKMLGRWLIRVGTRLAGLTAEPVATITNSMRMT